MKYKVLWIDDEYEKLSVLMEVCEMKYGFEIVKSRFAEEGMALFERGLYDWSAVVLDAKVLKSSRNEVPDLTNMMYSKTRIDELRLKRYVPTFIFTGENASFDEKTFKSIFGRFYIKGTDDKQLIADIVEEADKLVETQIIKKYADILDWYPNQKELISILRYVEENKDTDSSVFNLIRKELEWIMGYCNECGLLSKPYGELSLNDCSREFTSRCMRGIIPTHVQRSMHSAVNVSNEGSHKLEAQIQDEIGELCIDKLVKSGKAPYSVKSTIMDLLNIIYWAKGLPRTDLGREMLCDEIAAKRIKD